MNIVGISNWFAPEKSAGATLAKPAKTPQPSASAIVTLSASAATPAAPLTYAAKSQSAGPTDLLAQPLLLPTRETVVELAHRAAATLNAKLDAAGIPRNPPFELDIEDINSAHVSVKGGRPDAAAIEALINGDRELQMTLHNAEAIASSIPAFERAVAYQEAYRAARTQQQLDQINARFADLLSGHAEPAEIGMRYAGGGIQVSINGQAT